jgi:hypothetical protein
MQLLLSEDVRDSFFWEVANADAVNNEEISAKIVKSEDNSFCIFGCWTVKTFRGLSFSFIVVSTT